METLSIRMERHCENAKLLAECLEDHPTLESIRYPFLTSHPQHKLAKRQMKQGGSIITFIIKDGYVRAAKFMDSLKLASLTANLGDTRTIVTHPASTTHSKLTENERFPSKRISQQFM